MKTILQLRFIMMSMPVLFMMTFLSVMVQASSISGMREALIKACADQGESTAVCTCAFDQWQASIQSDETAGAEMFAKVMISGKPPTSSSQMMAMQPMMQRFSQFGMSCAMTVVEEPSPGFDAQQFAPNMPADQAAFINSMANDSASPDDIMAQLKAMDAKSEQQRAAERQKRQAKAASMEQARQQRKAEFRKELARVENDGVLKQSPADLKNLFYLSKRVPGTNSEKTITCLWQFMQQAAGTGPAGTLTVYFDTIGGGDFDQPQERRPYLVESNKRSQRYQQLRQQCFES